MSAASSPTTTSTDTTTLRWLALSLTPGLGPTRSRRLVDYFSGVGRIFHASLMELEAAGLLAESAQSIFTGKSLELAQEEMARVSEAKVHVLPLDDPAFPPQLKQIYDPPLVLIYSGRGGGPAFAAGHRHGGYAPSRRPTVAGWPIASPAIWQIRGW